MADPVGPVVRLVASGEIPVRISDWPEDVGIAICRVGGRTVSLTPYHEEERPGALRRRLIEEVGERLNGFHVHPEMRGIPTAELSLADDQKLLSDLETALRGMPKLIEEIHDFAINFVFAAEEGVSLDGKGKNDGVRQGMTDQLPVGYVPFVQADPNCEVISGAILRPAGAAGIDLLLTQAPQGREMAPEVKVLVREDSLRVAIPVGEVLVNGRLPPVLRMPAGSLLLGSSGGKPVPALVMRRGGFLFVAPDYSSVAGSASIAEPVRAGSRIPYKLIALIMLAVVVIVAMMGGVLWYLLQAGLEDAAPLAPVDDLRQNLFSPSQSR